MRNAAPQLTTAWPDCLKAHSHSAACAHRAAGIVNRTAIDIWSRQAHILTREMDFAARWLGAIAPRNAALRATCIEISRDDLDMVVNDLREIGQLVVTCGSDLMEVHAEWLRGTAGPAASHAP